MITKAILLAGGEGTRLQPLTSIYHKGLVPIYDKFIIDYPINTLVKMGIQHLTVVLGGSHFSQIVAYLKDGEKFGLKINYVYQAEAKGIAHAINLCQPYVESEDNFAVILGDNIYEKPISWNISTFNPNSANIALCKSDELNRFGVATIKKDKIITIEEKPKVINETLENYAVTGCYVFNRDFFTYFKYIVPSARGEYEITDIIECYKHNHDLDYTIIDGFWHDAGTFGSIDKVKQLIKQ